MRRAFAPALLAVLALAACSQARAPASSREAPAEATSVAADADAASAGAPARAMQEAAPSSAPAPPTVPGQPAAVTATAPMLAYSYFVDLVAPSDRARALMLRHQALCQTAGPLQCQVVSANESKTDANQFTGNLQIRATPAWLTHFRDGLEADARGAGGRVEGSRTTSEDLTRAIVDYEATLRAKTTLRDRLQNLVATHGGRLEDILNAERALAEVQGEIDQYQSELAVMRTRVNTSTLTLTYQSEGVIATNGVFEPVSSAVNAALGLMAGTLGVIIRLFAILLIPGLILWGILWLFRKRLPKFGRKPTPAPPAAS